MNNNMWTQPVGKEIKSIIRIRLTYELSNDSEK